jgi:hydroxymethylglutaryl-CoA synthase
MPTAADNGASLIDAELALPRLSEADPDEDAVTLAAEAALPLLERAGARPEALVLAAVAAPYDEGGNVQPLAELLGLAGDLVTFELTATDRDGLAAVRLACALARDGSTVLVCASSLAGAAALLLGPGDGIARMTPLGARAEELRDRWRLAGAGEREEADASFVWDAAVKAAGALAEGPAAVVIPSTRIAARAERARGGPGDPLPSYLGAAHAPARIVLGLDSPQTLIAAAGGLAEAIRVEPREGAAAVAARARETLGRHPEEGTAEAVDWEGISPYVSAPRSWRERGQDLRLEGARCGSCGRVTFPYPARCPGCGSGELATERLGRSGVVVTQTRDRAFPMSRSTGMAVVELEGGLRFYGQVVPSATVEIGQRVRLVPRRLHLGGNAVQYFWKVTDADRG